MSTISKEALDEARNAFQNFKKSNIPYSKQLESLYTQFAKFFPELFDWKLPYDTRKTFFRTFLEILHRNGIIIHGYMGHVLQLDKDKLPEEIFDKVEVWKSFLKKFPVRHSELEVGEVYEVGYVVGFDELDFGRCDEWNRTVLCLPECPAGGEFEFNEPYTFIMDDNEVHQFEGSKFVYRKLEK